MKIGTYVRFHKKSPYFSQNDKTSGVSVDFGICGFMNFNKQGVLSSKICPGCYSATLLNIYGGTRRKLVANGKRRASFTTPEQIAEDVRIFGEDCKNLAALGLNRLRFYAFADFSYKDIPYILEASKHLTVDIISKALVLPMNEAYLRQLNNKKNVWISLSFNMKFNKEFDRIMGILNEIKSRNIQLNWTINYKNPEQATDPRLKHVQVIHVTNKDKRGAVTFGFKETNVCGVFDKDGNRTKKGVCDSCKNCHLSFRAHQSGKKAGLPDILVA